MATLSSSLVAAAAQKKKTLMVTAKKVRPPPLPAVAPVLARRSYLVIYLFRL